MSIVLLLIISQIYDSPGMKTKHLSSHKICSKGGADISYLT